MTDTHSYSVENFMGQLPRVLSDDTRTNALAYAIAKALGARFKEIPLDEIYTRIDELPEKLLDILARDFKIDWYYFDFPVEAKRSLLKSCWSVHRRLGTKEAVTSALSSVFSKAKLEEWFEYGGVPYSFRLEVEVPENGVTAEQQQRALENIKYYKNVRSWLEALNYTYESRGELKAGAYTATIKRVEIWPELVEELDFTAPVATGGTVVTRRQVEVDPAVNDS